MAPAGVRGARLEDAPALAALATELGYASTAADLVQRLLAVQPLQDHTVLVAESGGVTVGWLHARICRQIESPDYAEIAGMVVTAARRSGGIGAALVAAAESWAQERGLQQIRVRSQLVRERAHRFYERLGYAETKRQINFVKPL